MSRLNNYRESVIQLGYEAVKSRVLETAFELDLFEHLGDESKTAQTLSEELKTNLDSLILFLNALVSLGLLESNGRGYSNTKYGREILIKGKLLYVGDIISLQSRSFEDWGHLKNSVLSGKPIDRPEFFKTENTDLTRSFALAMRDTAMGHAEFLAKKISLKPAKTFLDMGGGPGTFTIHFLKENPEMKAVIFDLPTTLVATRQLVKEAGLESRISFQAGDFNQDAIQGWFDICFLSHIIHGQSIEKNKKLFVKIFNVINPGGKLIVQDFFLNQDQKSPQFAAIFALNMLLHTDGGRTYTFDETENWMREAGFLKLTRSNLNLPCAISLVIGEKR